MIFTSCDDWNNIESIDIDEPNIQKQNPGLYAEYLANLRDYKKSDHKQVYVWYDNSEKDPFSRAHHILDIPDSVDIVALRNPYSITAWEKNEIETVRKEKGTKFIFTINYDAIKKKYEDQKEENTFSIQMDDFTSFLIDTLQSTLKIIRKHNLDGISIGYSGKSILHMTDVQKKEYIANENTYIRIFKLWKEAYEDKILLFEGKPQNLVDKTILNSCKYIILSTNTAISKENVFYTISSAAGEGVPMNRLIVTAEATSLDPADMKTGYWNNGSRAIVSLASLCNATYTDFEIEGLGIYNVQNDYFNPRESYQFTREAISIMNPF